MGRNILLGFAGPGEVSLTNAKDLLADHLQLGPEDKNGLPTYPDDVDEIRIVMPVADDYLTKTMELLLEWTLEYADLPLEVVYDEETRKNRKILDEADELIEARNVATAMIERLVTAKKNGDEARLIVAWGDDGDDHTEMLIELASVKDIKVLDLTKGLDDLQIEGSEPDPEPERPTRRRRTAEPEEAVAVEEEPAEEAKPTRRGKPRKAAETAPAAAEATDSGSLDEDVARGRQAAQKAAQPSGDDVVRRALLAAAHFVAAQDTLYAARNVAEVIEPSPLSLLLAEAVEAYEPSSDGARPEPAAAKSAGGRPRRDGSPAQPRSPEGRAIKEWLNEDGEWVKAGRGRLPKGVHTRTVDPKTNEVLSQD